jgi:endonuclease/exonuclease/phosphatase family metal-dependent hydrolase
MPAKPWSTIKVPGHWELQGFAPPLYKAPAEGTGYYHRTFRLDQLAAENSAPDGFNPRRQQLYLRFEGVLHGFDLWVNGKPAGAWGSAYNPATFDITDLVRPGADNHLAVRVTTRNKGWEFDTNDCWGLSGIYRDVYLYALPMRDTHIDAFTTRTTLLPDGSARLDLTLTTTTPDTTPLSHSPLPTPPSALSPSALQPFILTARLHDPAGHPAGEFTLTPPRGTHTTTATITLPHPQLWTAETPHLYELRLTLAAPAAGAAAPPIENRESKIENPSAPPIQNPESKLQNPPAPAPSPIRVLTFNLLGSRPSTEQNAKCGPWTTRKPIVLEIMQDKTGGAPYDFIGTQETSTNPDPALNQVNHLAAGMPGYDTLYAACNGEPNTPTPKEISMSNMILWRKDRWQIDPRDHGAYWLSATPEVPGSNQWAPGGKGARRNVTYGLFHEIAADGKRTGRKVYFYNTHLNVHVPDARAKSALLIMDRIHARPTPTAPVILTGDFNSRRDSIVYRYLTGAPVTYENERRTPPLALHEASAAAGNQNDLPRIDFIFFTDDLTPLTAARLPPTRRAIRSSDHAPVEASLGWKNY